MNKDSPFVAAFLLMVIVRTLTGSRFSLYLYLYLYLCPFISVDQIQLSEMETSLCSAPILFVTIE